MRKVFRNVLAVTLCLVMVLGMFPAKSMAASPSINKTSLTLSVGDKYTLKVNNTTKKVTWSSSKASVATVSSKGVVKAKKNGTATIKAKVGTKILKCKVVVNTLKYNKTITLPNLDITVKAPNKYNDKGFNERGYGTADTSDGIFDENAEAFTEAYNETAGQDAQGMTWSGGDTYGFYEDGINSTPCSRITYNGDGTYELVIGAHFGGGYKYYHNDLDITKYCADAILCELATMSSTPKTVYKKIYDMLYGATSYSFNTWYTAGDCKVKLSNDGCFEDDMLVARFTIKKK